jgi:hypothetical protein
MRTGVRPSTIDGSGLYLAYDDDLHAAEDLLHQTVLASIATGRCDDPAGAAKAALATRNMTFKRWYA